MSAQQATATGTLGGTPLGNLLIYALDRRLTGTLVIEDASSQKSALCLVRGAPVKVKLPEDAALLSGVLVAQKIIRADVAAEVYAEASQSGRLFGAVLLERTEVTSEVLADALTEQVGQKLEWLGRLGPESVYGYYDGQDFLREFGSPDGAEVEPLALVWRVLRACAQPRAVDATLQRLGTREVRLHPRSRVARFAFDPRERGIVDVLRAKPQSIPSLIATGILPEARLRSVLYTLVVTRHIDLGGVAMPVGIDGSGASLPPPSIAPSPRPSSPASPTPSPSPGKVASPDPPKASAQVAELREEIARRIQAMPKQSHYEILGVDPNAATNAIQTAFFQLAKRWHPDRLPGDLGDLKDDASRVFARMTEAHQVLSNDEQRREYERTRQQGTESDDEQDEVQRVLRAANAFQKAEVLLKRGNLDEAETHAAVAVENDPDQAEYVALYADLLSQKPDAVRSRNFQGPLRMVNEAKKKQPDNQRVLLYRARVLKRSGDIEAAYAEFRGIAQRDAHNVEAAREVRLHQMRRGTSTTGGRKTTGHTGSGGKGKPAEKSAGKDIGAMFGKLFKR